VLVTSNLNPPKITPVRKGVVPSEWADTCLRVIPVRLFFLRRLGWSVGVVVGKAKISKIKNVLLGNSPYNNQITKVLFLTTLHY
jgi:hypothetical protein